MSEFQVSARDELQTLVQFFQSLAWPQPVDDFKRAVTSGLNWELDREHEGAVRYSSGLPVSYDRVIAFLSQGCVTEVTLSVTDTVPGIDQAVLKSAQAELKKMLTDIVQVKGKAMYRGERQHWDLPTGGRIVLRRHPAKIMLSLLSLQYADIERAEAQQGLDPDVPIGDHQESQR